MLCKPSVNLEFLIKVRKRFLFSVCPRKSSRRSYTAYQKYPFVHMEICSCFLLCGLDKKLWWRVQFNQMLRLDTMYIRWYFLSYFLDITVLGNASVEGILHPKHVCSQRHIQQHIASHLLCRRPARKDDGSRQAPVADDRRAQVQWLWNNYSTTADYTPAAVKSVRQHCWMQK